MPFRDLNLDPPSVVSVASIPDQDAEKLKPDFQILKTILASHAHSRSRPSSSRSDVLDEENRTKPDYVPVEIAG